MVKLNNRHSAIMDDGFYTQSSRIMEVQVELVSDRISEAKQKHNTATFQAQHVSIIPFPSSWNLCSRPRYLLVDYL